MRDLEHAVHAQQQEKRQQYQRQMREGAQQQNRTVNSPNGPMASPSRTRTMSCCPVAEQSFEDRDAAHAQLQQQPLYMASPTRARPVTTSVTLASLLRLQRMHLQLETRTTSHTFHIIALLALHLCLPMPQLETPQALPEPTLEREKNLHVRDRGNKNHRSLSSVTRERGDGVKLFFSTPNANSLVGRR